MRRELIRLTILVLPLLGGCAAIHAERDDLCDAFGAYAESVTGVPMEEVTLRTDWSGEPTIACLRPKTPGAIAFCEYLAANSSIEFMSTNIRRALQCLKVD